MEAGSSQQSTQPLDLVTLCTDPSGEVAGPDGAGSVDAATLRLDPSREDVAVSVDNHPL